MIDLFKQEDIIQEGSNLSGELAYFKRQLTVTLSELKDYYRSSKIHIDSRHPVLRLLTEAFIEPDVPLVEYIEIAKTRGVNIGRSLGMTMYGSGGHVFDEGFFEDPYFILVYAGEPNIDVTWQNLDPVKILKHDDTSFSLPLPDSLSCITPAVVAIDVVNLLLGYRGYLRAIETPYLKDYVTQYVLPNTINSYACVSAFNRFIDTALDRPVEEYHRSHARATIQLQKPLDKLIKNHIPKVKNKNITANRFMEYIPYPDAKQILMLPDVIPLMQQEWLLGYSRIEYCMDILDILGPKAKPANTKYVNALAKYINKIRRARAYEKYMSDFEMEGTLLDMYADLLTNKR